MEPDYNLIQRARFRATGANVHHVNNKILAYTMCCEVVEVKPEMITAVAKAFRELSAIAYPPSDIYMEPKYEKALLHCV